MADKKISELVEATTPLTGNEMIEVVQDGDNKFILVGDIAALLTAPRPLIMTFGMDGEFEWVNNGVSYNDLVLVENYYASDDCYFEISMPSKDALLRFNAAGIYRVAINCTVASLDGELEQAIKIRCQINQDLGSHVLPIGVESLQWSMEFYIRIDVADTVLPISFFAENVIPDEGAPEISFNLTGQLAVLKMST